jgi:hypothetical protein
MHSPIICPCQVRRPTGAVSHAQQARRSHNGQRNACERSKARAARQVDASLFAGGLRPRALSIQSQSRQSMPRNKTNRTQEIRRKCLRARNGRVCSLWWWSPAWCFRRAPHRRRPPCRPRQRLCRRPPPQSHRPPPQPRRQTHLCPILRQGHFSPWLMTASRIGLSCSGAS